MIHARAPRLAATIVAASAVALAASACGGPMQAGAAAVVNGQRISDAQIQDQVAAINALAKTNNSADRLERGDQIASAQVSQIVDAAVWQRTAADLGVKVGPADVAAAKKSLVDNLRQQAPAGFQGSDDELIATADMLSQQPSGLAPAGVDTVLAAGTYQQAVITQEANRLKADPNTPQGLNALRADILPALDKAAGELHLKISPRYGSWNSAKLSVVPTTPAWIRAAEAARPAQMVPPVQQNG